MLLNACIDVRHIKDIAHPLVSSTVAAIKAKQKQKTKNVDEEGEKLHTLTLLVRKKYICSSQATTVENYDKFGNKNRITI